MPALVLVALVVTAGWAVGESEGSPAPANTASTAPARVSDDAPVSLRIPAIGVIADVARLGLNPDNTVQVPARPQQAGWYRLGPMPGQAGSAVILGHRDSRTGPAVFYRLGSLRQGDEVTVELADRRVAHFVVSRTRSYANADFPARLVYGPTDAADLQLVTCGGRYDHKAQAYTENVVAFTTLVAITQAL